jgi:Putative Flp pilus-assembly TadE/G-like
MKGKREVKFLRGQAAVALSLAIPMMVGAACIGLDTSALYRSSARLQRAADAAVLAGAAYLPANPALAQNAARGFAQTKGILENEIVYNRPASDGRSITMVVERQVPHRFSRLLNLSPSLVVVKAVARVVPSRSAAGLLPIGIQYDTHYTLYQPVVLKLASSQSRPSVAGTWKPLAMGACDGCLADGNYRRNLTYGYAGPVNVGDTERVVETNQAAVTQFELIARLHEGLRSDPDATATNYATGDPRRIEVPIVDFNHGHGGNGGSVGSVQGFATLWINSIDAEGDLKAEFMSLGSPDKSPNANGGIMTSMLSR